MTRADRSSRVLRIPRVRIGGRDARDAGEGLIDLRDGRPVGRPSSSRGAHALEVVPQPMPGALYLDPAVPADEVIELRCGSWKGKASHVWTGVGWARLLPGPVAVVPSAQVG